MLLKFKDCCYECGQKRYGDFMLRCGITAKDGKCAYCKRRKLLIPAADWAGKGD